MKKILTLLITFLMVIALGVTASAEDLSPLKPGNPGDDYYLVKVNNSTCDFEYEAYQIFKGTPAVNAEGSRYLADIEWGDGVDVESLTTALKATFTGFDSANTAADYAKAMENIQRPLHLAEVISDHLDSSAKITLSDVHTFQKNGTTDTVEADKTSHKTKTGDTITVGSEDGQYTDIGHAGYYTKVQVENAGYYLLKNTVVKTGEAGSRVILNVVGDVVADPKLLSAPTFNKTVGGLNDSKTSTPAEGYLMNDSYEAIMARYTSWQTTADHDIGDIVPYRLSITLPQKSTLEDIENYVIEVIDTMSPGLTLDVNSLKLFYGYSDTHSNYIPLGDWQWVELSDYLKYSNLNMNADHKYELRSESDKITLSLDDEVFFNVMAHVKGVNNDAAFKAGLIDAGKVSADDAELFMKNTVWYNHVASDGSSNSVLRIGSASVNHIASLIPTELTKHIHIFYECTLNTKAVVGTDDNYANGNPNTAYLKYSSTSDTLTDTVPVKNEVYTYQLNINKVDESSNALKGADFELLKFYKELKPANGTEYYSGNASNYTIGNTKVSVTTNDAAVVENVWVVVKPQTPNTKDSNGQFVNDKFNYVGIDNGVYILRETATPAGYNSLKKPIAFEIITKSSSTDSAYPKLEQMNVTLLDGPTGLGFSVADDTVKVVKGIASANIVNKEGVQLPSTGGMGTTLFYIAGAALIVAASITMIVKKQEKE